MERYWAKAQERFGRGSTDGARWCLCLALLLAPWLYGTTRDWSIGILKQLLTGLAVLFLVMLLANRRLPRVPGWAALVSVILFAYGWAMAFNACTVDLQIYVIRRPFPALPGSMSGSLSVSCMVLLTGMLGAFWMICDLSSNPVWRKRIWTAVGLVGVSIMLLGLLQRITGAHDIFWGTERYLDTFFATYRYHANAGAFINLVLPFIICRAVLSFRVDENQILKAFWCMAVLVAIVSAFVNVSRGSAIVTVLILAVFGAWLTTKLVKRIVRNGMPAAILIAVAMLVGAGVLLALVTGLSAMTARWEEMGFAAGERNAVYSAVWNRAIPTSGLFGFGPGTFQAAFLLDSRYPEYKLSDLWVYAHEDYLQTIMEWGWIGAIFWGGLFFGGLGCGIRRLIGNGQHLGSDSRLLLMASITSLAGVLIHSLVDFPLQMASLQLYAAVALGFSWSLGKSSSHDSSGGRRVKLFDVNDRVTTLDRTPLVLPPKSRSLAGVPATVR